MLALNCRFSESLAKIVLRAVSSAVTHVTADRQDQISVFFVVYQHIFESVGHIEEFLMSSEFALQKFWLEINVFLSRAFKVL